MPWGRRDTGACVTSGCSLQSNQLNVLTLSHQMLQSAQTCYDPITMTPSVLARLEARKNARDQGFAQSCRTLFGEVLAKEPSRPRSLSIFFPAPCGACGSAHPGLWGGWKAVSERAGIEICPTSTCSDAPPLTYKLQAGQEHPTSGELAIALLEAPSMELVGPIESAAGAPVCGRELSTSRRRRNASAALSTPLNPPGSRCPLHRMPVASACAAWVRRGLSAA